MNTHYNSQRKQIHPDLEKWNYLGNYSTTPIIEKIITVVIILMAVFSVLVLAGVIHPM